MKEYKIKRYTYRLLSSFVSPKIVLINLTLYLYILGKVQYLMPCNIFLDSAFITPTQKIADITSGLSEIDSSYAKN